MSAILWALVAIMLIVAVRKKLRSRPFRGVGSAAVGTVYDMLNEDQRHAVEIIVEDRAGARDPEDRDGNLPDLADRGDRPPPRP